MASEIILIRHAQASFGAGDYDRLSALGHEQARALGQALRRQGVAPGAVFIGGQRRHRETFEGLGLDVAPVVHEGLNEFDFHGLLGAFFRDRPEPDGLWVDRRSHFRALREAVLAWQAGEIADPPESWESFCARVEAAREAMASAGGSVLAVSSGGAIAQMLRAALDAPAEQMIRLQLQMKNAAVSRLLVTRSGLYLTGFNETPHIDAANAARLLTYS
ncbi:Broad specificity phosphatase PhoE [Meinhardsimonia xiamenensis]|jgi:broad specificity phosphatase PhoE|uniref:Broad specificity phosphatase PhoE n=1 Tax=Meinhardsimonia xiamenensis TaxID=990712 RepID=A0A1G9AKG4_9RHOB|nr:histidine phosphatase family protein [Meinhardsimonia xiamenensis]PRX35345.1 broad specificity phosphatase PhoE [Meinhardsimonia xiamenensis]SDK27751.1 Broad specificity phosphatase PhoE [Meinhardsimonia xiamenensis]